MLIVFSQKAGAGLFLHNLLHTASTSPDRTAQGDEEQQGFNYNCSCADDFMMPFTSSDEIIFAVPLTVTPTPVNFFTEAVLFSTAIFSSLRGPPVF